MGKGGNRPELGSIPLGLGGVKGVGSSERSESEKAFGVTKKELRVYRVGASTISIVKVCSSSSSSVEWKKDCPRIWVLAIGRVDWTGF